jgi:hypothetical protein
VSPSSVAEKLKSAELVLTVPEGPESMVVSGAVVSTVQVKSAGVGSVLPASSVAFTEKVWEPSLRPVRLLGEVHDS